MASRPRRLVALVDCSAFYCSCERVFDPSLDGVPVAVLSNNDGCVIARSQEVKDLGIPMGAPFFKHKRELAAQGVRVFSSNYTLYGDMSRRVMATLETVTPDVEAYRIDEAFLSVPTPTGSPEARLRRDGAPGGRDPASACCAGPASRCASRSPRRRRSRRRRASGRRRGSSAGGEPCVCLWGHPERERWLASMPVGDVWGVGRRWAAKLEALGATTASGLAALPDGVLRQRFNVVLLGRRWSCVASRASPLEDAPVARQTLVKSR